jgi:hypothetical protein
MCFSAYTCSKLMPKKAYPLFWRILAIALDSYGNNLINVEIFLTLFRLLPTGYFSFY